MLVSRGVVTVRGPWPLRLRAALLAGGLLLLVTISGYHDPNCPQHGGGAHSGGGHADVATEVDHSGDSGEDCSCLGGLCHIGGSVLVLAPAPSLPALLEPATPGELRPLRLALLPPPPEHLLPYATAPPLPLSIRQRA